MAHAVGRFRKKSNPPCVTNWAGEHTTSPRIIVTAYCVEDIVEAVTNKEKYPSPVRAVGSCHSPTPCFEADGGTIIDMSKMNKILDINHEELTVTVEAGAIYYDISRKLEEHGLMHWVNLEIGNITAGAAVLTQTKDSSYPQEFGQLGSYVKAVKMITAEGKKVTYSEDQGKDVMYFVRSSYGLLGIVYEVTFNVRPLRLVKVEHKAFTLKEFGENLPSLRKLQDTSVFMYMFPYINRILVEIKCYIDDPVGEEAKSQAEDKAHTSSITKGHQLIEKGKERHRLLEHGSTWQYQLRNFLWQSAGPTMYHLTKKIFCASSLARLLMNVTDYITLSILRSLSGSAILPASETIRFNDYDSCGRLTFSFFSFDADSFIPVLEAYFAFLQDYKRRTGWSCDLPNLSYLVHQDASSFLSYSSNGDTISLDPTCTLPDDGWEAFLKEFNAFCSERGGKAILNQSGYLTGKQFRAAYGKHIGEFLERRAKADPENRFASKTMREMFGF